MCVWGGGLLKSNVGLYVRTRVWRRGGPTIGHLFIPMYTYLLWQNVHRTVGFGARTWDASTYVYITVSPRGSGPHAGVFRGAGRGQLHQMITC